MGVLMEARAPISAARRIFALSEDSVNQSRCAAKVGRYDVSRARPLRAKINDLRKDA